MRRRRLATSLAAVAGLAAAGLLGWRPALLAYHAQRLWSTNPEVRLAAATAIGRHGAGSSWRARLLERLWDRGDVEVALVLARAAPSREEKVEAAVALLRRSLIYGLTIGDSRGEAASPGQSLGLQARVDLLRVAGIVEGVSIDVRTEDDGRPSPLATTPVVVTWDLDALPAERAVDIATMQVARDVPASFHPFAARGTYRLRLVLELLGPDERPLVLPPHLAERLVVPLDEVTVLGDPLDDLPDRIRR